MDVDRVSMVWREGRVRSDSGRGSGGVMGSGGGGGGRMSAGTVVEGADLLVGPCWVECEGGRGVEGGVSSLALPQRMEPGSGVGGGGMQAVVGGGGGACELERVMSGEVSTVGSVLEPNAGDGHQQAAGASRKKGGSMDLLGAEDPTEEVRSKVNGGERSAGQKSGMVNMACVGGGGSSVSGQAEALYGRGSASEERSSSSSDNTPRHTEVRKWPRYTL